MARTKRIAVINDLSGMGRCSLCADIAVFSAMGITPCPLPTAALSHQTAFESFYRDDLTDGMELSAREWKKSGERFDAVLSGYAAGARQLELIRDFIRDFRTASTLVAVDPIMGDDGRLYPSYDRSAVGKMRELAEKADLLTPNLTELCILCGADFSELSRGDFESLEKTAETAKRLTEGSSRLLTVTGISLGGIICNLCVEGGSVEIISRKRSGGYFSGTGDLFSAVVCGCIMNGDCLAEAVGAAADFVAASVERTIKNGTDPLYGTDFESELYRLFRNNK